MRPCRAVNYTSATPFNSTPNYIEACQLDALDGKRIGVPRNYINLTGMEYFEPTMPVFNAALDVLRSVGATVVDNNTLQGYDYLTTANSGFVVLGADFTTGLAR